MKSLSLVAESGGERLDRFLAARIPGLTRSQLRQRLARIVVNGVESRLARRLQAGDRVEVCWTEPEPPLYGPEPLELDILYEDEAVLVVNKPQGMVVHPGAGVAHGTLVQGLLHRVEGLRERFPEEALRPGIVHRLDKDTSGVIIAAKHPAGLEFLARQFRRKTVQKVYLALVRGSPPAREGRVEGLLRRDPRHRKRFVLDEKEGRPSLTRYRVLKAWPGSSLLRLEPATGRTHQLRVHMRALGCPILGDPIYGRPDAAVRTLLLHAWELRIEIPGKGVTRFRAPLPEHFKQGLRLCSGIQD